jgi:hypothetical protein
VTNGRDSDRYGMRNPSAQPDEASGYVAPHRGSTVLTLGILGVVGVCFICGIIAWVMGNEDLRAMREGRMDRAGEPMTSAGRICGMISTILLIVALVIGLIFLTAGGLAMSTSN